MSRVAKYLCVLFIISCGSSFEVHGIGISELLLSILSPIFLFINKGKIFKELKFISWFIVLFISLLFVGIGVNGWCKNSLIEMIQLILIFGGGYIVVCFCKKGDCFQLVSNCLSVMFVINLAVAILQLIFPAFAVIILRIISDASYVAGGTGANICEEMATGLFSSHVKYLLFMLISYPFIMAELHNRLSKNRFYVLLFFVTVLQFQTVFHLGLLIVATVSALFFVFQLQLYLKNSYQKYLPFIFIVICFCFSFVKPLPFKKHLCFTQTLSSYSQNKDGVYSSKRSTVELATGLQSFQHYPLGGGLGNYQHEINLRRMSLRLPVASENRVPRDCNGQYLVVLVESGWLAILLFLLLIVYPLVWGEVAIIKDSNSGDKLQRFIPYTTALFAIFCSGFFVLFLLKSIGGLFVVILGMLYNLQKQDVKSRAIYYKVICFVVAVLISCLGYKTKGDKKINVQEDAVKKSLVQNFWLEAEDADSIYPYFVVKKVVGASCGKALSIPLGIGKKVGSASYTVDVPKTAEYKIWVRVYWRGGCSNSLICQFSQNQRLEFADPIYKRWHWVDAAGQKAIKLLKGKQNFLLQNLEDGIMIDQIVFMSNLSDEPIGIQKKRDLIKEQTRTLQEEELLQNYEFDDFLNP